MKNLCCICLLLFIVISGVHAQEDNTLLNRGNFNGTISGFGGPIFSAVPINNTYGFGFGGGGGIVINDFFIGAFGMGNSLERSVIEVDQTAYDIELGYGGLWLGYSFKDEWLVHPYVSLRSGFGGIELYETLNDDVELMRESMVIMTPEVGLEMNVFQQLKLSTTVGYRWLSDFDSNLLLRENYSGMIGSVALRFGGF